MVIPDQRVQLVCPEREDWKALRAPKVVMVHLDLMGLKDIWETKE